MLYRKIIIIFFFIVQGLFAPGQSIITDRPKIKPSNWADYYVSVKLVSATPQLKPTYLLATKPNSKQKKWDLDTNKIDITNYYLMNKNILVSMSQKDCACDLFKDTTRNGVVFILLKPDTKLVNVSELIQINNIDYTTLDSAEIYINGKQILNDSLFIDSQAEVIPIYKNLNEHRKVIGVEIWTLTKNQRRKYGI